MSASIQPIDFPNPEMIDPTRPRSSYRNQGAGFHLCPGIDFASPPPRAPARGGRRGRARWVRCRPIRDKRVHIPRCVGEMEPVAWELVRRCEFKSIGRGGGFFC